MTPGDDAVRAALHAARTDPLGAVVWTDPDAVEQQLAARPAGGRLAGVPILLKDNIADAGQPLGACAHILDGWRAAASATVVERLRAAGAVVVGRTNMDAFGMGSSTETSTHGPTRHPLDPTLSPGGSSGGSAAAVAAGIVPLALGSDTGGSVRQPAAWCGVVGLRPTWGRVSRSGLVAFASSMDTIGPLGRSVREVARLLEVIAGPDPRDLTSLPTPPEAWEAACDRGVTGLRVGIVTGPGALPELVTPEVARAVTDAARVLEGAGARLVPVVLPDPDEALAAYHALSAAEAASNLARYDGMRFGPRLGPTGDLVDTRTEGFGPEVTRRLLLGTLLLSGGDGRRYHARASAARRRVRSALARALSEVDVLLSPTTPTVALPLHIAPDPAAMYRRDALLVTASLAGLPAISVPRPGVLPVGVQLVARALDESTLFAAAAALEASSSC